MIKPKPTIEYNANACVRRPALKFVLIGYGPAVCVLDCSSAYRILILAIEYM